MLRRQFLTQGMSTIAATSLLSTAAKAAFFTDASDTEMMLANATWNESDWHRVKQHFPIQEGLHYFNNASLGPSPTLVSKATQAFREQLEAFPSKYMWGGWQQDKERVREKAADMLKVSAEDIAIVHNTTEGMNLVASSLALEPGDQVIVADHEHPSGTIPWQYWQESKGIKLVRPTLPILPQSAEELVDAYRAVITPRTKVISLVHITNTNGMILPLKQITQMAHEQGIIVAVDGAQAIGMIPLDLADLGIDFYAASTHKWLFSPKSLGIFYAKKSSQHLLKPLVVAHGYEDTSIRRLENYNTRNLSEVLGLGVAIDYHQQLGQARKYQRILALKHYLLNKLEGNSAFRIKTPSDDGLSAGIINVEIVGKDVRHMNTLIADNFSVNCRPMSSHGLNGLRFSLSIFNTQADIEYLANTLAQLASA